MPSSELSSMIPAFPHHRSPCTREGSIFRPPVSNGRKSLGITLSKSGGRSASSFWLGPALSSRTLNTCRSPLLKKASQLSNQVLSCGKSPLYVVQWKPNLPSGDVWLE